MAVLLQRLGFHVEVLERSLGLTARGAGITLPETLVHQCIALDLFDTTIPHLSISSRSFSQKNSNMANNTTKFWQQPLNVVTLNWQDVYQNLHRRIEHTNYHNNTAALHIENKEGIYQIETSTGITYHADLIIAADGVDSSIRAHLIPDSHPDYTGYVAWRGLVDEPTPVKNNSFDAHIPYYVFPQGHLLLYRIPTEDYQETGRTQLNWVMYENRPGRDPYKLLIDKDQKQHTRSLPSGSLTETHIRYLHQLAERVLPPPIAGLIQQTQYPFLQAIFDFQLPTYNDNQIIFSGDAAITLRPHTASGVLKALTNGIAFANLIASNKTGAFPEIIKQWQTMQQSIAAEETLKAKTMGMALVTNPPNWDSMNQKSTDSWWALIMQGKTWYATSASSERLNYSIFSPVEATKIVTSTEESLITVPKK